MDSNFKILIINYEFPPLGGGGGVATYDLALEWAKKAQVDVLTSSWKNLKKLEKINGINVYRVKVLFRKSRDAASFLSMLTYLVTGFWKGFFLIKKNRYQIINTHFALPSGPLGFIFNKIFKIPNVLSLHGGDIYDPSKKLSPHRNLFFKSVVKFILNKATKIIAQSSNTRDNAFKYYNPKQEIGIIPLAFHPPKEQGVNLTPSKKIDSTKDDFKLITIGRLVKRKSIDTIIKALAKIDNKKIKLEIMGDGPEKSSLLDLVNKLQLQKKVSFLGFVSEEKKYQYLSQADLFVLTSLHEGFGIVYMEAMFFGLPIVCSNYGGQVDFLKNEENALLIDVEDVIGCQKAIERFYNDKNLYQKCMKQNIKKIKDFYAKTVAEKYLDLFVSLPLK